MNLLKILLLFMKAKAELVYSRMNLYGGEVQGECWQCSLEIELVFHRYT